LVRKRARSGIARRCWWINAVRHEGVFGCSKAQDKRETAGWAGEVIGDINLRFAGSVHGFAGWSIGETKALFIEPVSIRSKMGD
jgi:hypothetical protein